MGLGRCEGGEEGEEEEGTDHGGECTRGARGGIRAVGQYLRADLPRTAGLEELMRRFVVGAGAVCVGLGLLGCPQEGGKTGEVEVDDSGNEKGTLTDGGTESTGEATLDLSHVKVGQVYTYEQSTEFNTVRNVYVVQAVEGDVVRYESTLHIEGVPPQTQSMSWDPTAEKGEEEEVEYTAAGTVEIGGESFDLMLVEEEGQKRWHTFRKGQCVFPSLYKMEAEGMVLELKSIEQP